MCLPASVEVGVIIGGGEGSVVLARYGAWKLVETDDKKNKMREILHVDILFTGHTAGQGSCHNHLLYDVMFIS